MRIAVLSGKGGTGKTFIAVNLAYTAGKAFYLDCDVEEPNGWLFLKPSLEREEKVTVSVPVVDPGKCDGCGVCVDFCKFNALTYVKGQMLVFEEICHSCGGCSLLCPNQALVEKKRVIGRIDHGKAGAIDTRTGRLNTGEATGIPIIQNLFLDIAEEEKVLIDCPPGSSCAVMECVRNSDYCVLVTEPTRFGIHDLGMVYELVTLFEKPHGIVLNKAIAGENTAETFWKDKEIPLLAKIPYDAKIARLNSSGDVAAANPEIAHLFQQIWGAIHKEVGFC